ncbi:MAG: hypothetical protein HDR39_00440 [Treponema sp.]|nr:hypothetical protein [Treponema sp.]
MTKRRIAIFSIFALVVMAVYAATGSVYVTASGKKYHVRSCRTIARSKQVTALTVDQAVARGYEPCKVCHP